MWIQSKVFKGGTQRDATKIVNIDTASTPTRWAIRVAGKIDLERTSPENREFKTIQQASVESDSEWIHARIEEDKFHGACGRNGLSDTLTIFLKQAGA